jgi:hypothetical protein
MKIIYMIFIIGYINTVSAGAGFHIDIINNSNDTFTVTGNSNRCWYPYDLGNITTINPGNIVSIYTEAKNSGTCNTFFNKKYYQYFELVHKKPYPPGNKPDKENTVEFLIEGLYYKEPFYPLSLKNILTGYNYEIIFFRPAIGTYCGRIVIDNYYNVDDKQMAIWNC